MKMEERERIEGTDITIGRRVYYTDGTMTVSPRWAAEYRDPTGKQVCVNLKTESKLEARRKALVLHAKNESGQPHEAASRLSVESLVDSYFAFTKAKGVARKTELKYSADLAKLKTFCKEQKVTLAVQVGRELFYRYREWLVKKGYEPKTVYAALTVCKQVFKWGHAEGHLKEYRLLNTKLAEAKAKPQPCFTTEQVEQLLGATTGAEQAAIATLAYAGLRIGEVEQMLWRDVRLNPDGSGMFHVRLGGSNGTTKDKDARFVPVHPRIWPLIDALPRSGNRVFPKIAARQFLLRIKGLCKELKFPDHKTYKVHSFRHHFASLCANHHVAYRKALAWLGHSDSSILQLYYHLSDEDSQAAMTALAGEPSTHILREESAVRAPLAPSIPEGKLRANGESRIGNGSQNEAEQVVMALLGDQAERGRFYWRGFSNSSYTRYLCSKSLLYQDLKNPVTCPQFPIISQQIPNNRDKSGTTILLSFRITSQEICFRGNNHHIQEGGDNTHEQHCDCVYRNWYQKSCVSSHLNCICQP